MEKREQLKEQLKRFREERGISNNRISAALGISPTVLSQYLSGSYGGDNERVDELVEDFLNRERDKLFLGKKATKYAATQQAKRIYEALRMAHLEGEIAVIYGEAGTGKTTAVKRYAKKHPEVLFIEADLGYTAKILFRELHKKVGYDGKGSIHDMFEDITQKLSDTGRMLVIDEAEHLPYRALEMVRRLYDKAGIAVALVGMPRLVFNLRGRRGEYAQLYSRVGIACKVASLSESDTEKIVKSYLPESNGIWKEFYEHSRQNARHLTKLIYRADRIAQINNRRKIDKKIVKAAADMLLI